MNLRKQNIRSLFFIFLALYILGLNSTGINTIHFPQLSSEQTQNSFVLFEKLDLFCIPYHKEHTTNSLQNFYSLNFKKHLCDFSYQTKPFEILNDNLILDFILGSNNILYCFEPIILLFPHHYFW